MVNVHIGSAIFLMILFVLFVNFGMKYLPKTKKHSIRVASCNWTRLYGSANGS